VRNKYIATPTKRAWDAALAYAISFGCEWLGGNEYSPTFQFVFERYKRESIIIIGFEKNEDNVITFGNKEFADFYGLEELKITFYDQEESKTELTKKRKRKLNII